MVHKLCLGVCGIALALGANAQDTQFGPRGQQIPPPDCLNLHHAWEGSTVSASCPPFMHDLVFPAGLSQRRAQQAAAHGSRV
jgi:hypothetical protein